jgi:flagellar biosynthesis protein FliQ
MDQQINSFGTIIRRPSAFLPVAMSLTALTLVLVHIAIFGAAREVDEGTTAHLWQILMAGQMPVLAFFAIKWLPRAPKQTFYVLALQAGAGLASIAPVLLLNL